MYLTQATTHVRFWIALSAEKNIPGPRMNLTYMPDDGHRQRHTSAIDIERTAAVEVRVVASSRQQRRPSTATTATATTARSFGQTTPEEGATTTATERFQGETFSR